MNDLNKIDLRADRKFATGLGFFGGMLFISFILYALQMKLLASAGCLAGILVLAVLYRWLERDIPKSVDAVASDAAGLQDSTRKALSGYLREDD